jgi:hypothetical protein
MSVKPCDNCTMIMINYADLWLLHSHVVSLLDSARLKLRELKVYSILIGACTSCSVLRSDLKAVAVEINDFKHKLDHSSRYIVLSPPCVVGGSLKGILFHATKENTKLKQEVAYLTACLERTVVSEKMIGDDLSHVEESATKFTYKLGVGFERCGNKVEKRAPKFVPTSNYHKEEETIKSTKLHYPSSPKSSFNPKRSEAHGMYSIVFSHVELLYYSTVLYIPWANNGPLIEKRNSWCQTIDHQLLRVQYKTKIGLVPIDGPQAANTKIGTGAK